jgi:hypothetical protein
MLYVTPGRTVIALVAISTLGLLAPAATLYGVVHAALLAAGVQAVRTLEPSRGN